MTTTTRKPTLTFAAQMACKDFSRSTIKSLAKKGVSLIGIQMVPSPKLGWLDAEKCYTVDDNGTGRVWSFLETLALAK